MKLSIIVPVYNAEKYLNECVDSLINQDYRKKFEIILVDDGSTDNSAAICDAYAEKNGNVKAIHKVNGGVNTAILCGIENADGELIAFVDSDDFVDCAMFRVLAERLESSGADIVVGGYRDFENGQPAGFKRSAAACGTYDRNAIEKKILPYVLDGCPVYGARCLNEGRWGKLFKRALILDNAGYLDERLYYAEDLALLFATVADAQKIEITDKCLYYYRRNPNSITHTYYSNFPHQCELATQIFTRIADDKKLTCKEQIYMNSVYFSMRAIANAVNGLGGTENRKALAAACKKICDNKTAQTGADLILKNRAPLRKKLTVFLLKCKKYRLLIFLYRTFGKR